MDALTTQRLQWQPLVFGEVLFDVFPDGKHVLGGAPFNVAWHLQAFGLSPLFISAVGTDDQGQYILDRMRQWQLDTRAVKQIPGLPTGTVDVSFEENEPAYIINSPTAWDAIETDSSLRFPEDALLYHGSLALRSENNRALLPVLKKRSQRTFVDINLRPPWWNSQIADAALNGPQILKLNGDELVSMTGHALDNGPEERIETFCSTHGVEKLIITQGSRGVLFWDSSERQLLSLPVASSARLVDTVGAGDAFSSVCILGECMGWPSETTLTRALEFAAAIVGIRGATPEDKSFYQPFLTTWTEV